MLYKLILAHLVADFVLQFKWLVIRKRCWAGLAIHAAIVFLTMVVVAWDVLSLWWPWLLLITAAHAATDWSKIRLAPKLRLPPIAPFLGDQVVHITTITLAVFFAQLAAVPKTLADPSEMVWMIASVYVFCTFGASIALPIWLAPSSMMKRTLAPRLAIIVTAATVLTLAWLGFGLVIPLVVLGLYCWGVRRLGQAPFTATLGTELLGAAVLAASLAWGLR